jgi:hypothetical protein
MTICLIINDNKVHLMQLCNSMVMHSISSHVNTVAANSKVLTYRSIKGKGGGERGILIILQLWVKYVTV